MIRTTMKNVLLAGAMTLMAAAPAAAQAPTPPAAPAWMSALHATAADFGGTLTLERARTTGTAGTWFWLKGGSVDGSLTFFHGLGLAGNLTGDNMPNLQNGVGFRKLAVMAGPRYTFKPLPRTHQHPSVLFAEILFGHAHAHSLFPAAGAATLTAGSPSVQVGGGLDIALAQRFNLRPVEFDWVHTSFANLAANSQNDFRLAFGLSYRR